VTERSPSRPVLNTPSLIDSPGLRAQAGKLRALAADSEDGPLRAALLQIVAWYEKAAKEIEQDEGGRDERS
jgi:hypothetical protein